MIFGVLILGVLSGVACCVVSLFLGATIFAAIQVYMASSLGTAIGVLALKAAWCLGARALDTALRRTEPNTQPE